MRTHANPNAVVAANDDVQAGTERLRFEDFGFDEADCEAIAIALARMDHVRWVYLPETGKNPFDPVCRFAFRLKAAEVIQSLGEDRRSRPRH